MFDDIEIELFRFDAKVDYLPYYKKYILRLKKENSVLEVLREISKIEKFKFEDNLDFNVKINNLYFSVSTKIKEVITALGTLEWRIEPISTFRAIEDLIIDKTDFMNKINLLSEYVDEKEKIQYVKNYLVDYYASTTYEFNKDYIGDGIVLIIDDLLKKSSEKEKELLKFLSDQDSGIYYHTSLQNKIYNYDDEKEKKIVSLMKKVPLALKKDFHIVDVREPQEIKQTFENFNIASFNGIDKQNFRLTIEKANATFIALDSSQEDLATHSLDINKDFSLKIIAKVLLEAVDKNADFLVVRGKEDLNYFDKLQVKIELLVGREFSLPIITREEFVTIVEGKIDTIKEELLSHKVKVSFL